MSQQSEGVMWTAFLCTSALSIISLVFSWCQGVPGLPVGVQDRWHTPHQLDSDCSGHETIVPHVWEQAMAKGAVECSDLDAASIAPGEAEHGIGGAEAHDVEVREVECTKRALKVVVGSAGPDEVS